MNNIKSSGGRGCARHPYLPVVGVCACCLRDRLNLLAAVAAADDDYELPTGVRDEVDERDQKELLLREAMMIHLQAPRSPLPTGGGRHSNACHLERYRVVNRLLLPPARHSDASAYGQKALHQLRQKLQDKDRDRDRSVKDEESVSQAPANPKKKRNPFWSFPTPKKTPSSVSSSSLQSAASSSSSTSTSTSWISSLFPSRWRRHSHHAETETRDPSVFIAGRPSTVDGSSVASSVNWINHNRRKPLRTCIDEDEEEGYPPRQSKLVEKSTTAIATAATVPAAALPNKDHSAYKLGLSFISRPFSRRRRSSEDHNGTSVHPSSPFHPHGTPLLPPPSPFSSKKIKE